VYTEFNGTIMICTSPHLSDDAEQWISNHQGPLGFDCEWKPDRKGSSNNPIALVQLADAHTCLLLQTGGSRALPPLVARILQDVNILKVCSGHDSSDSKKMISSFGFQAQGVYPLDVLAKKKGIRKCGLQGVATYCGMRMRKDHRVCCSDWGTPVLSSDQIRYAADDAWFSYILLRRVEQLEDRTLCPIDGCSVNFPVHHNYRHLPEFKDHMESMHLSSFPDPEKDLVGYERTLQKISIKMKICAHCASRGQFQLTHSTASCEEPTRRPCLFCLKSGQDEVHEGPCPVEAERIRIGEEKRQERIAEKEKKLRLQKESKEKIWAPKTGV